VVLKKEKRKITISKIRKTTHKIDTFFAEKATSSQMQLTLAYKTKHP